MPSALENALSQLVEMSRAAAKKRLVNKYGPRPKESPTGEAKEDKELSEDELAELQSMLEEG